MIPKIIHYVWLGDNPLPAKLQEYVDGWHELMPDYEIKRWDLSCIELDDHPFVKEAVKNRRWAFAADYIRTYALMTCGGIYMDTDVKVIKRFDPFLHLPYFTSFENHYTDLEYKFLYGKYITKDGKRQPQVRYIPGVGLMSAIMGSEKGGRLITSMYELYRNQNYYNEDGSGFQVLAPWMQSYSAEQYGLRYKDEKQVLTDGAVIFPSHVFAGLANKHNEETVAIHMEDASWVKNGRKLRQLIAKIPFAQTLYRYWLLSSRYHYYCAPNNESIKTEPRHD